MNKRIFLPLGCLFLTPFVASAQDTAAAPAGGFTEQELLLGLALGLAALLIFAVLGLLYAVVMLSRLLNKPVGAEAEQQEEVEEVSFWQKLTTKWNDAVPVEREEEVLTDHEYDGIHELDNNLPPWWKAMFYVTIVFAVVYLGAAHIFDLLPDQREEYETEMVEAKLEVEAYMATRANAIDENNVELDLSEDALAAGSTIFAANCAACHAPDLGGGVGPNLVDAYWLHGGSIGEVFATIKHGVPQKGMISWKSQLSPLQMQQVASYILSMQGTEPANPKEPQGDPVE